MVAARRALVSSLTRLLWGRDAVAPSARIASRLFLAGLGLVYLIAFVSLGVQVQGLAGEHGILPIAPWLERAAAQTGWERYWIVPTLAWLDASDAALWGMCVAGASAGILLAAGIAPTLTGAACWILYLSLSHAVPLFLGFQWDTLLLEAGLIAVFLYPSGWRVTGWRTRQPARPALFLIRWLLFRLMLGSGLAKLGGGDPVWRDLTALAFHYETQPIPTWTAWLMHQLPLWAHKASTLVMFVVELALPWLIFAPRRPRHLAFTGLAGLQIVLLATGNFAFFNWLSLVLCLVLVEDAAWPAIVKRRLAPPGGESAPGLIGWGRRAGWLAAAVVAIVSGYHQAQRSFVIDEIPAPVRKVLGWISPLRSLNGYGLFVNMRTERPEITIEGTVDGEEWRPYAFRWKPGDPARRPPFVAPHQPRLDWQMWFAALGDCRRNPWVVALMRRILEGSPPVMGLLDGDPFEGRRPRSMRAVLWKYRFTDPATRAETGAWWVRERKGLYCLELNEPSDR
jgi:hypothetical protein